MTETDVLIIGGGIAGTTAAETFRAGNPDATVTIVSDEKHPLYSRVLLPHAVKGRVDDGKVYLKGDGFYEERGLVFLGGRTVTGVDPERKHAIMGDGSVIRYGKLVVAAGGTPKDWDVPGADLDGVLRLQAYEDIEAVRGRMGSGGETVIVGTGFIALEFAAFASHFGSKGTVINRGPHFGASVFGPEMGREISRILVAGGVEVMDGAHVERVLGETRVEGVRLRDGRELPCGTVGLGIGLDLNTSPFKGLGVNVGVVTDASLRTAFEDVWAAGDCCEFQDPLLGLRHVVGNWTNAMAQGRHVGRALLGAEGPFEQLTAYTSMCFPGLALIHLGETRMREGIERESRVLEEGKAIEIHRLDGRVIGAALLNAPNLRAGCADAIMARTETGLDGLLS